MIQQVFANKRKQARQAKSLDVKSKVRFEVVGRETLEESDRRHLSTGQVHTCVRSVLKLETLT